MQRAVTFHNWIHYFFVINALFAAEPYQDNSVSLSSAVTKQLVSF
jgi:hypothetical protein